MHCKKCLHYEVCVKLGKPSLYGINQEIGCSAYKDKEKWAEKKDTITNADRIRAFTDDELAKWIDEMYCKCPWCDVKNPNCDDMECVDCLKKWLKQSPKEEK